MSRVQFGVYTKKLRTKKGLSQQEVARALEATSGQIVSNWERGACYPPLMAFSTLAVLYGVNLKSFFDLFCQHQKEDQWRKLTRS